MMNLSNSTKNFHISHQQQMTNSSHNTSTSNIIANNNINVNITAPVALTSQLQFNKYDQLPPLPPLSSATGSGKLLIDTYETEMNTVSGYFAGEPLMKGYFVNKINPSLVDDFSYLNRNKLVNRRMAIRKQMRNSAGLVPISKHHENYTKKNESEFTMANPTNNELNSKNNIKQQKILTSHSSIEKYFQLANTQLYHPFSSNNDQDIFEETSLRTFKSLPMQLNSMQKPLTNKQPPSFSQNNTYNNIFYTKVNKSASTLEGNVNVDFFNNSQNQEFNSNLFQIDEVSQLKQDKDEQPKLVRR